MNTEKLSSDEVPQKLVEWLVAVGCPVEKIPSIEKMTGMCRGLYMAWRSLIEHVQPKDVIGHKRLTVFCDDIKLCQEKKLLNETGSSALLPEQLSLWKEHKQLKEMVTEAESCVGQAKLTLNELMDRISSKLIQRNSSRVREADLQRRSWLLNHVSNELTAKKANLEETRIITDSLCNVEREQHDDIQRKVDKCIALLQQRNNPSAVPLSSPVASSSIMSNPENDSTHNEKDDYVLSLVKCRGEVLWPHLCEKLVSVNSKLSQAYAKHVDIENNRIYTKTILAYTAALHSTLALEAIKNKAHIKRKHQQLAVSIEDLNSYVSEEAFELLVVRFQRAYSEARVKSLKESLEQLTNRSGVFDCGGEYNNPNEDAQATLEKIASIDKCIVNSRHKLERLMSSLAVTERKIYDIRECLLAVFSALHNNAAVRESEGFRVQLDFPKESIALLRQFYMTRCDRNSRVGNLSLKLDMSDNSFLDIPDNPKFVDELKIYLRKFNLEKNRKLVLDSGEKIWIFETLQSLSSKLCSRWLNDDVTPLLCPSVRPSRALEQLYETREKKRALISVIEALRVKHIHKNIDIDITAFTEHEADIVDKIKKLIAENLNVLKKIHKNLDICEENLEFWSEHQLNKYVSPDRTIDGKTYRDYEALYAEKLMLNC